MKKCILNTLIAVVVVIFLLIFYICWSSSISFIEHGRGLHKATEVDINQYFKNFFIDNEALNSFRDNAWFVVYEDSNYIYYSQKCLLLPMFCCHLNKVNKQDLKIFFPLYEKSDSVKSFWKIVNNYIESNKVKHFNFNECKFIGGLHDNNFNLKYGIIEVAGMFNDTCQEKSGQAPTKGFVQLYNLVLSADDFNVINHYWFEKEYKVK